MFVCMIMPTPFEQRQSKRFKLKGCNVEREAQTLGFDFPFETMCVWNKSTRVFTAIMEK